MGSSITKGTGLPRKAVRLRSFAHTMPMRMPNRYSPIITKACPRAKKAAANRA